MTQSSLSSSVSSFRSDEEKHPHISLFKRFGTVLLPLAFMCLLIALTPPRDPVRHLRTPLEWIAHELGHGLNSAWVGVSLLLLVAPALFSRLRNKALNLWAKRAIAAIFLDFLFVDLLGKDLFTSLGRPGRTDQPGFPSGHTTMAFLMAWLIWKRYPKWGTPWFLMAALVGWSRVQSHAHFPYQVIAGAWYGCALGAFIMGSKPLFAARLVMFKR